MSHEVIIREFLSIFFSEPEKLDKYCSEAIVLHWRGGHIVDSLVELKKFCYMQIEYYSDFEFHIQDVISAGDKVAARLIQTGVMKSCWEGVDRPGASFRVDEMMFFQLQDGLITDIWPMLDMEGKKQQLMQ